MIYIYSDKCFLVYLMFENRMRVLVLDPILITVITPTKCYWMCPCIYDNPPQQVTWLGPCMQCSHRRLRQLKQFVPW